MLGRLSLHTSKRALLLLSLGLLLPNGSMAADNQSTSELASQIKICNISALVS